MSAATGNSELSGTEDVLVDIQDRIATVWLNRPAKHTMR